MLEVESKLASTREERDQLLEKIRADEAEKKMMRESIEVSYSGCLYLLSFFRNVIV